MKNFGFFFSVLVYASMLVSSCDFGMTHAHCEDTTIERVASPNGTLEIATFHRTCSRDTSRMTYAKVEEKSLFSWFKSEPYCYLMTWKNYHPVEAIWLDESSIKISTSDKLKKNDFYTKYDSCQSIKVAYDVQFEEPPPLSSDSPDVGANIKKILAATEQCMRAWSSSHVDQMVYGNLLNGNQRDALAFIFVYVWNGHCSLNHETFELMKGTAQSLQLDAGNWQLVEKQVAD